MFNDFHETVSLSCRWWQSKRYTTNYFKKNENCEVYIFLAYYWLLDTDYTMYTLYIFISISGVGAARPAYLKI
jgi:hypothetical protein